MFLHICHRIDRLETKARERRPYGQHARNMCFVTFTFDVLPFVDQPGSDHLDHPGIRVVAGIAIGENPETVLFKERSQRQWGLFVMFISLEVKGLVERGC